MFIREELEENPVIEKDLTVIRQETREIDQMCIRDSPVPARQREGPEGGRKAGDLLRV